MRRPATNRDLDYANEHAARRRKRAERDARERQQRREKAHRQITLRRRQRREWRLVRNLVRNGVVS